MSSNFIRIVSLSRLPKFYDGDELVFQPGVNVIAGEKDAGKTKWLQMLDYLLGETGPPEEAFGKSLAEHYESVRGVFKIGKDEYLLERRWKEHGNRGKVFVNGEPVNATDFSSFFLEKLGIPILTFPKGNPYDDRTWPELSWRMLYRHIYRQERFWSDFAERQPPAEQHACLAQFLGVADALYPVKFGELVRKQKELARLQAQRENFVETLQMVTKDLLAQREMRVAVTEEAINATEERLKKDLNAVQEARQQILKNVRAKQRDAEDKLFRELQARRSEIEKRRVAIIQHREATFKRLQDLVSYVEMLTRELGRVQRLKSSGELFADLKVTQCPVCDQPVIPSTGTDVCYLCGKHHPQVAGTASALNRLDFEQEQLQEEKSELDDLQKRLGNELDANYRDISELETEMRRMDASLAPARDAATAMLPPDWEILTEREGRLKEQAEQLTRVRAALRQQKELSDRVESLTKAEVELKAQIGTESLPIDLINLGQKMEDGMNSYLNIVAAGDAQRWQFGRVSFFFGERSFQVKVNGRRWDTQLGAASQALILFAYHYALLSLVAESRFNYPGLVIVDFPVELMDSKTIGEGENYLVEPFIELCSRLGTDNVQFIAAGRAFLGLEGANRIKLDRSPVKEKPPLDGQDS
jgi:uncharacterized Zn finger protein (UPF0148 family)